MGPTSRVCLGFLLAVALSACSNLPRGGAVQKEITRNADAPTSDIAVYPVTRAFLPSVQHWPSVGEKRHGWIGHSNGSNAQIIRPGDQLDILVWDSGDNSLLTSADQRVATLPNIRVSENGSIFVPYVGKVQVSGRTPDSARQLIQRQLEAIVQIGRAHV